MVIKADVDAIAHAVNLLVCVGGLATATAALGGAAAVTGGFLSWREIRKRLPGTAKTLADELTKELERKLGEPALDDTTRLLIPQMVEASVPSPVRVMEAGANGERLAEEMAKRLTDKEHRKPDHVGPFQRIVGHILTTLLADPRFSEQLAPAFREKVLADNAAIQRGIDSLIEQFGSVSDALAHVGSLAKASRDQLEALAARFEIERVFALDDAALRDLLEKKAEEYRSFKAQIDAIDDRIAGLGNLKLAARAAADKPDLEEVERLLLMVHEAELDIAWQTASLRVDNALLRGRVDEAFHILGAAADAFAAVDPVEPARRLIYDQRLFYHADRYGGDGFARSVEIWRHALELVAEDAQPGLFAAAQNNLGNALGNQGSRVGGEAGARLLGEAVDAYRAALPVYTEADHPVNWAMAQNNLGSTLGDQGNRIGGEEGARLLGEAVDAYRAALRVYTEADHPVKWATTQNNLGAALTNQGSRIGGEEGARLLGEAVAAFRAALCVYTEADHPVDWAMTQNNLGNALGDQGSRIGGEDGARLFGEAVDAYRAALCVRTETNHPVRWAMTQNNLGGALVNQGKRVGGEEGAGLLGEAVDAYGAALRVYTEAGHPVDWAMTQANLALVEENRAEHDAFDEPSQHLEAALAHLDNALRVFDPEHMLYNHGKATQARARIVAKLAALGDR